MPFAPAFCTASNSSLASRGFGFPSASVDGLLHLVEEAVERLLLLGELFADLLLGLGVAERALGLLVPAVKLVGELVLLLGELAGLVPHGAHVLVEAVGRLLAHLLAEVVELPLGAGPLVEGLRDLAFVQSLGGLADLLAALLDLGALLSHPVAVFLALHPLANLVGVAKDLLFLVAKALELALGLGLGLGGLGGFERGLQLLEALVEVGLPTGEFGQAVDDLAVFTLLGVGLLVLLSLGRLFALRSGSRRWSVRVR